MQTQNLALVVAAVGALSIAGACGGSDSASQAPPVATTVIRPAGCAFDVATREDYKDWRPDHAATSGAANIRRVRLGLGGELVRGAGYTDPSRTIAVGWQTDDGDFGGEVRWGETPEPSAWSPESSATGVTWLTPQGLIGPNGDERMHEVYVCGLKPATRYYYQVRSGGEESEVYSFVTAPADPNSTVKIAVTGDSRGQHDNAWQLVERRVREAAPTLQLFSGDMVDLATSQVEWESWVDNAWKDDTGAASSFPTVLSLSTHGNHENHTPLYFGNVVIPQSPAMFPSYLEYFFSFDVGPVHVIVMDDFAIGSPSVDPEYASTLRDWLQADLDAANAHRQERPWIVVMHHHGEYSSSTHGEDPDVLRIREFFVPMWDAAHVNLVVNGHDHNYERTKPLRAPNGVDTPVEDPSGTTYIVCAGAGADGYGARTSSFTAYSASYTELNHIGVYGLLTASPSELRWQAHWIDASAETPVEPEVVFQR